MYDVGAIITFTHGCYSDYGFTGPFRVLRPFDATLPHQFAEGWRAGNELMEHYDAEDDIPFGAFIAYLIRNGYVEDIDNIHELFLGSYGVD